MRWRMPGTAANANGAIVTADGFPRWGSFVTGAGIHTRRAYTLFRNGGKTGTAGEPSPMPHNRAVFWNGQPPPRMRPTLTSLCAPLCAPFSGFEMVENGVNGGTHEKTKSGQQKTRRTLDFIG